MARAYTAVREVFEMRELWSQIQALDNRVSAQMQYTMLYETGRLLRHLTYWLLMHRPTLSVEGAVAELRGPIRVSTAHLSEALAGQWRTDFDARWSHATQAPQFRPCWPDAWGCWTRRTAPSTWSSWPARPMSWSPMPRRYFGLGARLGLDWIHAQVEALQIDGNWQAVARSGLRDSVYQSQRLLTRMALNQPGRSYPPASKPGSSRMLQLDGAHAGGHAHGGQG